MKQLSYILIVGTFLVGWLSSCEKYIDFEDEIKDPKLVVNGLINPDSTFDIHISRSLSVIDDGDLSAIENAEVVILDSEGNIYESLVYDSFGHYKGQLKPLPDELYSIEVDAPDYTSVSATTYIPSPVDLSMVDTLGVEDLDGYKELEITITFQDDPQESNYYRLEVYSADIVSGQIYSYPMSLRSDDLALGLGKDGYSTEVVFSDELFDGDVKDLVIYVEDSRGYDDYIEIRMSAITQDQERYVRTLSAYENNFGNPFAQPVQVYSNIEGGFGIFSGYRLSRRKINF